MILPKFPMCRGWVGGLVGWGWFERNGTRKAKANSLQKWSNWVTRKNGLSNRRKRLMIALPRKNETG